MPARATCRPAQAQSTPAPPRAPSPWSQTATTCRLDGPAAAPPALDPLSAAGLVAPESSAAGLVATESSAAGLVAPESCASGSASGPPSAATPAPSAPPRDPSTEICAAQPTWAADIPSPARSAPAVRGYQPRAERLDWGDRTYDRAAPRAESSFTARVGPDGGELRQRFSSGDPGALDPDLSVHADQRGAGVGFGVTGSTDDGDWRTGFALGTSARAGGERRWQTDDGMTGGSSGGIELSMRGLTAAHQSHGTARFDLAHGSRQIQATGAVQRNANLDIRTERPVRHDDPPGYRVRYRAVVDASAVGSLTGQLNRVQASQGGAVTSVTPMVGMGIHAGFSGSVAIEGVRIFADEETAQAFYQFPDAQTLTDVPTSAAAAQAIPIGESRRISGEVGANAGVHGDAAMVRVGASRGIGGGIAIQIERESERWTLITLERSSSDSASGNLSGPLLGLTGTSAQATTQARSFRVDLGTPAGELAYGRLMLGIEPELCDAVQPAGSVAQDTHHTGFMASNALLQVGGGQLERSRNETRADGSRVEHDEGAREQSVTWWRWLQDFLPAGHGARGVLSATEFCPDDSERGSHVASITRSKGQGVQDTWRMLNQLEGTPELLPRDRSRGEAGEWTLSRDWGPESLDELVRVAWSVPASQLDWDVSERGQMLRALRAADGDRAAQRAAVRAYGSRDPAARTYLQSMIGRQPERYLGLEGSSVWIGPEGWRRAEERLRKLVDDLVLDDERASTNLHELRDQHLVRLNALQDWSRFSEVPHSLRRLEIRRTRTFLDRVDQILASAGQPQVAGEEGGAAQALLADVAAARDVMQASYDALIALETRHGVGRIANGASLWERLGGDAHRRVDAGPAKSYHEAERLKREGEQMRRAGAESERVGRARLREGTLNEADAQLTAAIHAFASAEERFDEVRDRLRRIEAHDPAPWRTESR